MGGVALDSAQAAPQGGAARRSEHAADPAAGRAAFVRHHRATAGAGSRWHVEGHQRVARQEARPLALHPRRSRRLQSLTHTGATVSVFTTTKSKGVYWYSFQIQRRRFYGS